MSSPAGVDTINSAIGDVSAPVLTPALGNEVTLIRGLWSEDLQKFETEAVVRELTGEDEEFLASVETKPNVSYGDYMAAILSRAVVTIGSIKVTGPKVLDTLLPGDRDLLFLQTIKTTYGVERTVQVICPKCNKKSDVVIELAKDFPNRLPDFPIDKPVQVQGRKVLYKFNLPSISDVSAASVAKTMAESNTIVLSRCAVFDGDEPADRLAWARSININDRHKIIDFLLSIELGPKLKEVDTHCSHCDEEMPIALNWVSLLLS